MGDPAARVLEQSNALNLLLVGQEEAVLKTERSANLSRPVRGAIVSADGRVLFESRLIEFESGQEFPEELENGTARNEAVRFNERR